MPDSVQTLIERQNETYGYICRTVENLNKLGADKVTLGAIRARIKTLDKHWDKYTAVHDEILAHKHAEDDPYFKTNQSELAETKYAEQMGILLELEIQATAAANQCRETTPGNLVLPQELIDALRARPEHQQNMQLPRIQLPKFDGSYAHWPHFRDLFTSLVGSKNNITRVEKFHHLKTSLEKEALQLINNLAITDANYDIAWAKVKNKYENRRLLVNSRLAAIDAITPAKSESAGELKRILLSAVEAKDALDTLGRPVNCHADWLVYKITKCLDPLTRRDWETANGAINEPIDFEELQTFLETRIKALEAINETKSLASSNKQVPDPKANSNRKGKSDVNLHVTTTDSSGSRKCSFCSQDHFASKCEQYKHLSPGEKKQLISSRNLCLNCLSAHKVEECKSRFKCFKCSEKHHTSIHDSFTGETTKSIPNQPSTSAGPVKPSPQLQCIQTTLPQVVNHSSCTAPKPSLLATAYIKVIAPSGSVDYTRALVDSCSTDNIIAESLAQRLKLPRQSARYPVSGTGKTPACTTRGAVSFEVKPHFESEFQLAVNAYVVNDLTHYVPNCYENQLKWPHLQHLTFADPGHASSKTIEVILGVSSYARILEEGVRKGPSHAPIAQHTSLGWIIFGELPHSTDSTSPIPLVSHQCQIDTQLPELLQRFWEQEDLPSKTQFLSDEDQFVEDHFKRTHSRGPDGRYTVRLPIKQPESQLGDSMTAAQHMLRVMDRRFARNDELRRLYTDFMGEYIELGQMELVDTTNETKPPPRSFYLPHHGVLKDSSTTTKLRVVFNGSQKTNLGTSLNAQLCVGPKLLPELSEVLTAWRTHKIAFSADMEKMYRQINVHEDDRDLQRLLWYQFNSEETATYRLTTVPFGLSSSPFQAIRTLHQLADDERDSYPVAAEILKNDTYVDDVLSGADNLATALSIQGQLINLLKAGGFSLRKWTSNDPRLVSHLPADMVAQSNTKWQSSPAYKMLGLTWQPNADLFVFNVKTPQLPAKVTKRNVLSMIAQLFDPLGWLAPAIVTAKIFMQSLWQIKLSWDDPLPENITHKWKNFQSQLHLLSQVSIPRYLGVSSSHLLCELHGFSDASEQAYAAVLYIRVAQHKDDFSTVVLIASKTKVAPLKTMTLPKLELSAALLLAKLSSTMQATLKLQHVPLHLHSDSTITIHWVRDQPSRWKTFVANRVAQIQRLVPAAYWHHVCSEDNPADIATRELEINDFILRDNWWKCSALNLTTTVPWPPSTVIPAPDTVPEHKTVTCHQAIPNHTTSWDHLGRYSTLNHLLTTTAWILRYVTKLAKRRNIKLNLPGFNDTIEVSDIATPRELDNAAKLWTSLIQHQYYESEIKQLKADVFCRLRGPLYRLTPFIDEQGILRVGGRLKYSLLDADEKQPMILPRESNFTTLLVRHQHEKALHDGTQLTLSLIRRKFWIIRGRSAVKTIIFNCFRCWKQRKTTAQQLMADLPQDRVNPARPFLHSGIDYAGPILVRTTKGRGQRAYKGWIAIFICLATRAIHLELVSDYESKTFIAAYHRFTARRGICATLRSDRGTTFIGADKELRALFDSATKEAHQIEHILAQDGTKWVFNPPAAPHFGGLWEAGVKSVKHHLKRTIGDSTLTFEEMSTLLAQVEACLNSRPLQAITDDPDDFSVLTPGHFLIGGPPATIPEPSLAEVPINRLTRWQAIRQKYEHFWQRWSHEYLHELQMRSKWSHQTPPVQVGDLALLKEDSKVPSVPTKWKMARVIETHPGPDGLVRVVTVRTATSTYVRPIAKLCLLPKADEKTSAKVTHKAEVPCQSTHSSVMDT